MLFKILNARKTARDWRDDPDSMIAEAGLQLFEVPVMIATVALFLLGAGSVVFGYILDDIFILKLLAWLFFAGLVTLRVIVAVVKRSLRGLAKNARSQFSRHSADGGVKVVGEE